MQNRIAYGRAWVLGNKCELEVEYNADGGLLVEAASIAGIYLDNDKKPTSLNINIPIDLSEVSDDFLFNLEQIASYDNLSGDSDE